MLIGRDTAKRRRCMPIRIRKGSAAFRQTKYGRGCHDNVINVVGSDATRLFREHDALQEVMTVGLTKET